MTYLEKYKMDHPGLSDKECRNVMIRKCPKTENGRSIGCPEDLKWSACHLTNKDRCPICWNREIPGTEPTNETNNNEREDKNMNKNFTKDDLKVGYVVRTRVGDLYMVMPVVDGMSLVKKTGSSGMPLGVYNKDMQHDAVLKDTSYDITEVYGHSVFSAFSLDISTEKRELLWKREEAAKKMTVAEIEKALGYKVEVVADEK